MNVGDVLRRKDWHGVVVRVIKDRGDVVVVEPVGDLALAALEAARASGQLKGGAEMCLAKDDPDWERVA